MNVIISLLIIAALYFTPLNSIIYNNIYDCIGSIISNIELKEILSYIPFIKNNIQGRVTSILYIIVVILLQIIISKLVKVIINLIDEDAYRELDCKYRNYLYKYTRGTKELNYILILGVSFILIIMSFLRVDDSRIYVLGVLLIIYLFRIYKPINIQEKVVIKEDRRYKTVRSITKKVSGGQYKTLRWKYIIDHCQIELPIEFQATVRVNDESVLRLPNGSLVEVTVNDLAKEIENACKVKELKNKSKIHVVLSLLSQFKYEVVEDNTYKENKDSDNSLDSKIDTEVQNQWEYSSKDAAYKLKTPRSVIESECGNGVELGKCAIAIFRAMLLDTEEIEIPRKDGERKVAFYIEGADIETSDKFYMKDNKKYYYCEILKNNKYYIGEKLV